MNLATHALLKPGFWAVILLLLPLSAFQSQNLPEKTDIYHDSWIDFNKDGKMDPYEDSSQPEEVRIADLLSQMTLEEKSCQLATLYGYGRVCLDELPTPQWKNEIWKDGIGNIDEHLNSVAYHPEAATDLSWPPSKHVDALNEVQRFFVEETRLGIPVDFTNEGIRGLCSEKATSFPSQVGVGATWNKDLVRNIGLIEGKEARLLGYTNVYAPILDLARDPRWGRVVECYGEDPFLVGELGYNMVQSLQEQGIVSTPKHFAVYSAPKGGRDGEARTDPHVTEREMQSLYLYPFKRAIKDAGAMGVMSSYNDYNGIPVTGSEYFLTELLREQWGFKGYVVSDSRAVEYISWKHSVACDVKEAVYQAITAGLNIRTDFTMPQDYILPIRELALEGRISEDLLNSRVADVLRVKFWQGLFDQPYGVDGVLADEIVGNSEGDKVAYQASLESVVLLKNEDQILPLDFTKYKSILVTGPNAKAINHSISRYGPSNIEVTSILDGIRNIFPKDLTIYHTQGCDFFDENWPENELYPIPPTEKEMDEMKKAVKLAKKTDLTIVVVGDDESTVGESRSRTSLNLPGNQQQLVESLYATGKPVVVVLVNGRALTVNWIDAHVPAIVEAWFQGKHGGSAVADVLAGNYNPGGKLPVSFPRSVGQIPMNFPTKPGAQADQPEGTNAEFQRTRNDGFLYPFGYGLSYTTFTYSNLSIERVGLSGNQVARISLDVSNSGDLAGDEVVQLYFKDLVSSVTVYEQQLRGFERVALDPGESKKLEFFLDQEDLALLDRDMNWVVEAGEFEILVGSSSEDIRLKGSFHLERGSNLSETLNVLNDCEDRIKAQLQYCGVPAEDKPFLPRNFDNGDLRKVSSEDWTSGFFPGMLWKMYEMEGDLFWKEKAELYTLPLASQQNNKGSHDLGFMMYNSFGQGYRLTGDPLYKDVLIKSAESLASRYNPEVGCIRSWDHHADKWDFPVIIDNMMNLELLFWAWKETGREEFYEIALDHATTTMENHFREDFSSWHVVDYDPLSGEVESKVTNQGYSDESAWSRGQAWGLYGFTMMYRETGREEFLEQAEGIAGFLLNHPRLPEDYIPYWDMDAPIENDGPRDASAAAIMASALYELAGFSEHKTDYLQVADKILNSLSSPSYMACAEASHGFLLEHSTGNMPIPDEVDVPIIYADYYFLEAIQRRSCSAY